MKNTPFYYKKVECVDGSIGYLEASLGNGMHRIRIPNKTWPFPFTVELPRTAFKLSRDQSHGKPSFDKYEEALL